jgi:hypothetical protein
MSTQKNESTPVKDQAKNSTEQNSPNSTTAQNAKGPEGQRKPEANASDRDTTKERENDSKRPTTNSKKH